MPLRPGKNAVGDNIKTEMAAGKPRKQAIAIALSEKDRTSTTTKRPDAPTRDAEVTSAAPDNTGFKIPMADINSRGRH